MYDSLDKIGLKAVLEAIKGKMPTSLPANGGNAEYATNAGNADTLNGMDAESIRSMAKSIRRFRRLQNTHVHQRIYTECGTNKHIRQYQRLYRKVYYG